MYSAAFVLSVNGFTGISLITLVATLSDLFIGVIPIAFMTCFSLSSICL
jgi:hypothetical protein